MLQRNLRLGSMFFGKKIRERKIILQYFGNQNP